MKDQQQIISAIAKGEREAFQKLYALFASKIYNTALSYVQNEKDAEEITQDVFISIYQNAANFKGESLLGTWIYRITVNRSLNLVKSKKRFSFLKFGHTEIEPPDFDHPGILLENKEKAASLFATIRSLPEKQKTAFILSFVEELPRQEVADIMELSLKAIESLLQRAKSNLRKKLEKSFPERRNSKK